MTSRRLVDPDGAGGVSERGGGNHLHFHLLPHPQLFRRFEGDHDRVHDRELLGIGAAVHDIQGEIFCNIYF